MRIIVIPVFILFAFAVIWAQQGLPFHNAWDMDLITVMDLYQMADGILPQHINHTGMGLYLIQRWALPLGNLSAHTLSEVLNSPLPLLPIAEATVWVRSLNVIPAVFILLGCTWGLVGLFNKSQSKIAAISISLVIATWAGLWGMQLFVVRSELYALGFYSLAFALIMQKRVHRYFPLIMSVSILAGIGFLTKFQGFFLHAAILFLLWESIPEEHLPKLPSRSFAWTILALFLGISFISLLSYIPNYFAVFSPKKGPNLFFIVALVGLCLPLIAIKLSKLTNSILVLKSIRNISSIKPNAQVMNNIGLPYWVVIGLLSAFFFHLFMFMSPSNTLEYFFFDWRMIFLKLSSHNTPQKEFLTQFWWNLKFHLLPVSFLGASYFFFWKNLNPRSKIFSGLHAVLVVISLVLVSRGRVQDTLWNDVLIIWGFRYFIPNLNSIPKWVIPLSSVALIGWNLTHLHTHSADGIDYAPQPLARFWQEPYESPNNQYTEIMSRVKADPFSYEQTNLLANNYLTLRESLKELWGSPTVDLKHVSLASPEFKDYLFINPPRNESIIRPKNFILWLGSIDVENFTDCPLTPEVVTRDDVRWRQIQIGTKKCKIMSKKVQVALNFRHLLNQTGSLKE